MERSTNRPTDAPCSSSSNIPPTPGPPATGTTAGLWIPLEGSPGDWREGGREGGKERGREGWREEETDRRREERR